MFEMHDIMEGWLLDSTEEPLSPWKAALLRSHLRDCARCRGFALELVEFSHDVEAVPRKERLKAEEASLLHAQVMAAFHRERQAAWEGAKVKKLQLRTYFGVTPGFARAMALVALVLGLALWLSLPGRNEVPSAAMSASVQDHAALQSLLPQAEPSPTSTPLASNPELTPGH
jgi:hypothetical protein